jgi:hypothetical protein
MCQIVYGEKNHRKITKNHEKTIKKGAAQKIRTAPTTGGWLYQFALFYPAI